MSIYQDVLNIEQMYFEANTEEDKIAGEELLSEVIELGAEKLCKIRANKVSRIEALKNEENRIKEQRKSEETKLETLERYILSLTERANGKIEAGTFKCSIRKSESVNIINEDILPREYKIVKEVVSPDKIKIKQDIQQGVIVDGAELKTNYNLQVK